MLSDKGTVASLAPEFPPATLGPAGEELLEVFLIGGQALFEAVHRLLVTLTGLQPTEAVATQGTSTCRDTQGHWGSPPTPWLGILRELQWPRVKDRKGRSRVFYFFHLQALRHHILAAHSTAVRSLEGSKGEGAACMEGALNFFTLPTEWPRKWVDLTSSELINYFQMPA
jgi:hypothetical protein